MRCPQPGGVTLFNSVALNHSVRDAVSHTRMQCGWNHGTCASSILLGLQTQALRRFASGTHG